MARPVRIEFSGAYYYISSKGIEGEPIFNSTKDRQEFITILEEVINRMHWEVYAYNLLSDSYQLFIKTSKANLSKGMRQLNGIYTQRYNARYNRTGNIFHGRFKAVLVEAEHSFEAVIQHVLSMPIQMQIVQNMKKWKWSSYRASIGMVDKPDWLKTTEVLSCFSKQKKRSQKILLKKINQYDKDFNLMKNIQGQILLGSNKFVHKWKKQLASGKVMDKARKRRTKKVKPLTSFSTQCNNTQKAIVKAYGTGNYTLKQIGDHFGVHYSTVSRTVKRANVAA
ncbi:MAG: transposase [gamma proteobacterium symbiont of Taylorina sp.]|nr:transposase [gamma proteobacterium symbiont of Taylorina sp.]